MFVANENLASAIAPTTTVEFPAPVAFDLYRDIHKGIRAEMFAVTLRAGQIDPDDAEAVETFGAQVRALADILVHHAEHEDNNLDAVIALIMGDHAVEIRASHGVLERRFLTIVAMIEEAGRRAGPPRRAAVHEVYLELAAFTSLYLQHQDDEERVVMRALDRALTFEEVLGLHHQIIASVRPDVLMACLALMLPAVNLPDRCELLGGMQASAPAEAFAAVWALAAQVLDPRAYLQTAGRLGLPVAATAIPGGAA